jgi:hypothetical protein
MRVRTPPSVTQTLTRLERDRLSRFNVMGRALSTGRSEPVPL